MTSATIASHSLAIDGMTGDACVNKVTGALKGVNGVTTQSVKVGAATIESDDAGCRAACSAINTSGFKAREAASSATTGSAIPLAPEVPSAEHKGRNQNGTPILNTTGAKIEPVAGPAAASQPVTAVKATAKQFGRDS